jgi:polygalacturonase
MFLRYSKLFSLAFFVQLGIVPAVIAQKMTDVQLKPVRNAPYIAYFNKDTIAVVLGSTYRYTVDTPEDKGLVSTNATVAELVAEAGSLLGNGGDYTVTDKGGVLKTEGVVTDGDHLVAVGHQSKTAKIYQITEKHLALTGRLMLERSQVTANVKTKLTLMYSAGQRTPDATVKIIVPIGVNADMDNTTVDIIGRGTVKLKDLSTQSIGRTGTQYSYTKVGIAAISNTPQGQVITLSHLDLRPDNGADVVLTFNNVEFKNIGDEVFKASYTTTQPEQLTSSGNSTDIAVLHSVNTITDFTRMLDDGNQYHESADNYTSARFKWTAPVSLKAQLMQSADEGKSWQPAKLASVNSSAATVKGLQPNQLYAFKLVTTSGLNKGVSNVAWYYSGKMDIKNFGVETSGTDDNTDKINLAIDYLNQLGGGVLRFSKGTYSVRTVHLKSNVYLYVDKDATIQALKGNDQPETTWFCDKKYRSGLSPTDFGPYADPENYMTKQDVGHQYFHNAMFFGERLQNIKIIGNGRITGNSNLVNGDKVMSNPYDNRADKMFALKQCHNVEIGGILKKEDLWYDADKDEPFYIGKNGSRQPTDNMLNIDRAGHFVLLATGTDEINMHDDYMGRQYVSNSRDIFDFMGCRDVNVTNIYSKTSSDDIIKLGSDCSLGFTRPARNYKVRNIIGDTNCNLLQIGSETADDITDVYVDNIYILGANKAGFSISANDGAHIKNVQLNSGYTGPIHSRSKMYRATTPFFISISNRGRVIGADAGKYAFTEDGKKHNELLVKNVDIGQVEDIKLNGVDVYEVYSGSSYSGKRWKPYDGTQKKASPIIAGYKLPDAADVEGRLDFKLPNGKHTGYIKNITLNDINVLVKGGNPLTDTTASPGELGVGKYNVGDLKIQPSYALWARHVMGLKVENCTFNYEKRDSRYPIFLDDVIGADLSALKLVRPQDNHVIIALKNSRGINVSNIVYFNDTFNSDAKTLRNYTNQGNKGTIDIAVK